MTTTQTSSLSPSTPSWELSSSSLEPRTSRLESSKRRPRRFHGGGATSLPLVGVRSVIT